MKNILWILTIAAVAYLGFSITDAAKRVENTVKRAEDTAKGTVASAPGVVHDSTREAMKGLGSGIWAATVSQPAQAAAAEGKKFDKNVTRPVLKPIKKLFGRG